MEDDKSILSNSKNNPSINEPDELNKEEKGEIDLVEEEKEEEVAGLVARDGFGDLHNEVNEIIEADDGGEEKGGGAEETESKDAGLKSEEDSIGIYELPASVDGGVDMMLSEKVMASQSEDSGTDHPVVEQGDEAVLAENLLLTNTADVVEELPEDCKVELHQSIVIEKNVNTEIEQMTTMGTGNKELASIENEDNVVHKLVDKQTDSGERTTADCDDTMNDGVDGVIHAAEKKMEMEICAESNMMMGEGSKSEDPSTPCHPLVDTDAISVAKDVNDEVKEAAMKANLVDADKEVGINVEESRDSKEVDSESTVSESFADKSGKDDEVERDEEDKGCDIGKETEANTEADTMDITKDEEPEVTGDSDELQTPHDEEMVAEEENADTEVETETDVVESGTTSGGKRKRGKTRNTSRTKSTPKARKTIEEDVCYICYDGGDLVLCDRRGCPKAYHTYCVNRDEKFFQGKGRWNCGWHLCSICEKNSQYFCYTCPFSLCKGCIKDDVILCVRGKKGFCQTCIKAVKLIENNEQGVKNDQVNFDDKGSWEYLFRDYFIELKSKLSLSSAEIAEAKSPWKGLDTAAAGNIDVEQESPEPPIDPKDDAEPDAKNLDENEEATKPRRKKLNKRLKKRGEGQNFAGAAKTISNKDGSGDTEWASTELLEFVMHMKSGDRSILSEYDVQALLLEYIKRNNLRDPRQKSRIICDPRLQSLFGKPRVAHFEMLKLLESHIFVKDAAHIDDVQGSVVDTNNEQLEVDESVDTPKGTKEKKRKSRKKGYRGGPQSNLNDYAAIDMHNISLIYLRRKLVEDLLEDIETFQDKVACTFVRIRISGSVQKQELYRLVQVVGTSNAADPYKVGKRSTNIMFEILNLNKTEVISIDTISNQDFSEDECKRLRQSIKCGLINRLTVGDVLHKATELQAAKVNDWLETEIVRLSHLCDRASEKGRKKELRECVEKLLLLKTPEERQRRLDESPEIHADPKMDPNYESENDDVDENRQDANTKIGGSGSRGGRGQISPGNDTLSKDPWSRGAKYLSRNCELDRNLSSKYLLNKRSDNTTHFGEVQGETSQNQEIDCSKLESSNLDRFVSNLGSVTLGGNRHDVPKSESLSLSASKAGPALAEAAESTKIIESEKNWHYKDPSGKVQGPFSIVQLRKWNNTGYFPAGLTVWRTTEKQEDSILLSDALSGKFFKESAATAGALPSTLSANLTSIMASLEHAREHQDRDKLRSDLDASGNLASHIVSPGRQMVPSVEHPKLSTEKWSQSESSSLPSPTPIINNAGFIRQGGSLSSATSYLGRGSALPSPTAVLPEYEPVHTGLSGVQVGHSVVSNTFPKFQTVDNSEVRALQAHGNVAVAQDSFAPQAVGDQNPKTGSIYFGSAQSHIVDPNAAIPVQPQIQARGQWGNIPTTGYMNPGNVPQVNQPNMQLPALHNMPWAAGIPENNTTTPGPIPENSTPNLGWGGMQGNQSTMWMGVPHMNANANVNWGACPPQGPPPPANQNMGWTMPPGNLGAAVQGQLPAGTNPGWSAGTGNPPVPGLPPAGNVNQSWVSPQSGNVVSNVHMPASGRRWSPAPANLGAPVPGNVNQGLSTPPGNQGPYRADQNHSGSKFSRQRDQGSYGGNSGYEGDRSRIRPSSFGNGGPGGPSRHSSRRHQIPCPYNQGGRCRKGADCNYLHT